MVTAVAPAARDLDSAELRTRARRIRLVLTDCDGTLTDGTVYYSESGEVMKRFSLRDGLGVERLRDAGIATAMVTREVSLVVRKRAEKLRLPFHFDGILDKAAHLPAIERATGIRRAEMAYVGDDLNDLGIVAAVAEHGLVGSPADAAAEVLAAVHHRGRAEGGRGAFREFAEWILRLRAKY
jgi:3-deoxy-D-manno-octulosonate 8-phosphate phosphatase (KDO 8-P phosphatase)